MIKTLTASIFEPSEALTGDNPPSVFRGENLVLRGMASGMPYFEAFGGNRDLGENYNLNTVAFKLTGTISYTAGSQIVAGAGTLFVGELHIGQMILSGTEVFVVAEVVSDASFVTARAPAASASAQIARRLPQLFQVAGKRGVMLSGNAIQFVQGHFIAVGSGELFINGSPLAGNSLTASNKPKIALYRSATADYSVQMLGFAAAPPPPVVNPVAGGTKGMADGKNSFMISYWSPIPEGTDGYSNPCKAVKLDGAATPAPLAIDTAGGKTRYEFDFTNSLVGMPSNAKGFIVWGSLSGKKSVSTSGTGTGATTSITSPNQTNYENGSWFEVARIKVSDLSGANKAYVEYLDSDVGMEVSGNNDAPPACEFVALIEGKPMYISCYGRRRVGGDFEGSNPGTACVVSKESNPDGAPSEWAATISHDIIGWFEGVGRWFLMTASSLDFVVSTGLLGQSFGGGQQLELPIVSRPYWKTGASNRYSTILVDDTLYGFSGNKLFKSVGNGDENVQKYEFGSPVEDITRTWTGGYVLTAHDAKNNNVCFIHSAAYKNAQGYWVSLILPYSLFRDAWLPVIVLSSPTRDMIVSGAANVNERLEFLAGGRVSGGTFTTSTFRFDEVDPVTPLTSMPYYLVWQLSDDGQEDKSKVIQSIRPVGKFTSMKIQIHGARPGEALIVQNIEQATNSISGDIAFPDTTDITRYMETKMKFKNLAMYAIRLSGVWDGAGIKDRLDELAIEISTHGRNR